MPGTAIRLAEIARFLRTEGARRQFFPVWTEDACAARCARPAGRRHTDRPQRRQDRRRHGAVGSDRVQAGRRSRLLRLAEGARAVVQPRLAWLTGRRCRASAIKSAARTRRWCAWHTRMRLPARLSSAGCCARCTTWPRAPFRLSPGRPRCARSAAAVARAYPHVAYPSRLYLARCYWVQSESRLHEQLDDRPAYVDIATL